MAGEIGQPVGREGQLERELEKKHRADRQVGPGKELVLADREPRRGGLLEHDLGRDQAEEHQDQDKHGVFQDRDEPAAEERLHPQGQQLFLPRAVHPPRQALDPPRLAAQPLDRRLLHLVVRTIGTNVAARLRLMSGFASTGRSRPVLAVARDQRRHDSASLSRSSRISFSRVTARRSGMSSRNAIVSPTSSTAVWTMRSQASPRPARSSALIRSKASSASSARRRSSEASHSIGLAANPGSSGSRPAELGIGLARAVGRDLIEVERLDLRLEPREMKSLGPEPVGAPADGRPGQLALDAALQKDRLHPLAAGAKRLVARVGLASRRGAQPAAEAIELDVQPGRDGMRRLLSSRATRVLSHSRSVRRPSIAIAWCNGPRRTPVSTFGRRCASRPAIP